MTDLLTNHAAGQPDKIAVVDDRGGDEARILTYAELEARSNQLAHVVVDHGITAGDTIIWCGQNSVGVVEFVNAARKIGATAVPLNYRLSDEEAAYVTDHSDAALVYVDAASAPMFERIRADVPKVRDVLVFDGPAPAGMVGADSAISEAGAEPPASSGSTDGGGATMIYTSGTTGKPKGAYRSERRDPE